MIWKGVRNERLKRPELVKTLRKDTIREPIFGGGQKPGLWGKTFLIIV